MPPFNALKKPTFIPKLLKSAVYSAEYPCPNSGSTGFSNSDASRVTIVSPDGVTKYRRLSSTGS